jgi:hypothetical protein
MTAAPAAGQQQLLSQALQHSAARWHQQSRSQVVAAGVQEVLLPVEMHLVVVLLAQAVQLRARRLAAAQQLLLQAPASALRKLRPGPQLCCCLHTLISLQQLLKLM